MVERTFHTQIGSPVEVVFELIADLANYGKWLSASNLYGDALTVSDDPIKAGTTYVDKGKSSTMRGTVSVFEPPTRIGFKQESPGIEIDILYTLTAQGEETEVSRRYRLTTGGIYRLLQPFLIWVIGKENERILARMKAYLEAEKESA